MTVSHYFTGFFSTPSAVLPAGSGVVACVHKLFTFVDNFLQKRLQISAFLLNTHTQARHIH
jgi:hypothetical protein